MLIAPPRGSRIAGARLRHAGFGEGGHLSQQGGGTVYQRHGQRRSRALSQPQIEIEQRGEAQMVEHETVPGLE